MIIPINRAGEIGIVKDVAAHSLPLNAWSAGQNVRFIDGAAEKFLGQQQQFGDTQVAPYFVMPIPTPTDGLFFWLYAGLAKVYVVDQASLHTNLTRQTGAVDVDYSATAEKRWNGGILSGIPIINNGVDDPQMWNPMSTGQRLQKLSNWPASTTCRTLRPFKRFLIALDVTKSGTRYPRLVKWSHPADVGFVPATWDETDETKDAGEIELAETGDYVVDAVPLGDNLVIYKENSIWGMQFIGGIYVFRTYRISIGVGILNVDWAVEIPGNRHLVFTGDDLVVHQGIPGAMPVSVLQGRWRQWLRDNLDSTYFKRSFIALNLLRNEAWLCFSVSASATPNRALCWNWTTNSLTLRELPGVSHGGYSINRDLAARRLLLADPTNSKLYYADESDQFNGSNITATLERTDIGLPLGVGEPPDMTMEKSVRRIYPRITGTPGGVVNVYRAMTTVPGETPVYGSAESFTIGTTQFIEVDKTGYLLNLKFESNTDINWKLHGYEVDFELSGRRSY